MYKQSCILGELLLDTGAVVTADPGPCETETAIVGVLDINETKQPC